MRSSLLAFAALSLGSCAMSREAAPIAAAPLALEIFGAPAAAEVQTLLVIVPGDPRVAPSGDPADFARAALAAIPGAAAAIVTRPGHPDRHGRISPGPADTATGDGYTADRLALVAETVALLRRRYPKARTVMVGEAGGGAIAAGLAGIRPGLFEGMVLVGCPCSLPEWRRYMAAREPNKPWNAPVASLDPLRTAGGVDPAIRVALVVGEADRIAPPRFSRAYAEALALRGIATDYRVMPGDDRATLNDAEVLSATTRLALSLTTRRAP